jgi:hypothetical protein
MAIDQVVDDQVVELTLEEVAARNARQEPATRVVFQVAGLYGFSLDGIRMPLSERESIASGQVTITLDPDAEAAENVGIVDYEAKSLRVRYGVQAVFPALHELVTSGKHDASLLSPVRAVATDDCTVAEDFSGWRALGVLEFRPGSLWAGAGGG